MYNKFLLWNITHCAWTALTCWATNTPSPNQEPISLFASERDAFTSQIWGIQAEYTTAVIRTGFYFQFLFFFSLSLPLFVYLLWKGRALVHVTARLSSTQFLPGIRTKLKTTPSLEISLSLEPADIVVVIWDQFAKGVIFKTRAKATCKWPLIGIFTGGTHRKGIMRTCRTSLLAPGTDSPGFSLLLDSVLLINNL